MFDTAVADPGRLLLFLGKEIGGARGVLEMEAVSPMDVDQPLQNAQATEQTIATATNDKNIEPSRIFPTKASYSGLSHGSLTVRRCRVGNVTQPILAARRRDNIKKF